MLSWRGPGHPNAGGAEISTHEHAKGWVKNGHDVTLFTAAFKGCKEYEVIDGVNVIRRGGQIFGVHWEAFKWYLFGNHHKFDLVVDQFHGVPFFTPFYVRAKKLGFIHEVTKEVWSLNPWNWPLNLIPALVGSTFEPLIFKLVYKKIPFMTVSESTKEDLTSWGIPKNNITIIHNGLGAVKFNHYPHKLKKKTIIFLGALSKDKGIEDAIKVFSIMNNSRSNLQFWVVGKGEKNYLEQLKLLVLKLEIDKKVKFWGFVSDEKKIELLARSDIAINTSIREGWGLVVIEAASVGIPTVAFNVSGLRDSIINGKTGVICNQNTSENMALNILSLVNDRRNYNRMSKNAIFWSKKFSWDKASNESLDLLKKIVRN